MPAMTNSERTALSPPDFWLNHCIRQYRVGKHQSGKGPRGVQRLGYKTLITPAKANVKAIERSSVGLFARAKIGLKQLSSGNLTPTSGVGPTITVPGSAKRLLV